MKGVFVIQTAVPTRVVASKLARALIQKKLAACVHIAPQGTSIYRWKGKIEQSKEYLLTIKTSKKALPSALQILNTLHPYELPEILAIPVTKGFPAYIDWITKETIFGD